DLDIEYHPLACALATALNDDDFTSSLGFLSDARLQAEAAEPWMEALNREAETYLWQLRGDWYLEQATAKLAALEQAVLQVIAGQSPSSPAAIQAHAALIQMYRLLGMPWRVEAAYRRLCAAFGPGSPTAHWQELAAAGTAIQQ